MIGRELKKRVGHKFEKATIVVNIFRGDVAVGDVFLLQKGEGEGQRLDQFLDVFQKKEFVRVQTALQKGLQG